MFYFWLVFFFPVGLVALLVFLGEFPDNVLTLVCPPPRGHNDALMGRNYPEYKAWKARYANLRKQFLKFLSLGLAKG